MPFYQHPMGRTVATIMRRGRKWAVRWVAVSGRIETVVVATKREACQWLRCFGFDLERPIR